MSEHFTNRKYRGIYHLQKYLTAGVLESPFPLYFNLSVSLKFNLFQTLEFEELCKSLILTIYTTMHTRRLFVL